MATLPVWLSRASLIEFIGTQEIPATFKEEKLNATVNEVVEGWLTDLLTPDTFTAYGGYLYANQALYATVYDPTDDQLTEIAQSRIIYNNSRLIRQFVAYAVWAIYINKANAINTDTGIVSKTNNDSIPISQSQRTELSNYYRGLAERKAREIAVALRPENACAPYGGSGRPRIQKAQPPSPSRLGN